MKTLDIKVERTGFPVQLAGMEFFFDCSSEHIAEYEVGYQALLAKLKDEADNEDADLSQLKSLLGDAYDLLLGDGSFDKLYDMIPDIIAWKNALQDLSVGIYENVELYKKEQQQRAKELKEKYFLKKAKKNKR